MLWPLLLSPPPLLPRRRCCRWNRDARLVLRERAGASRSSRRRPGVGTSSSLFASPVAHARASRRRIRRQGDLRRPGPPWASSVCRPVGARACRIELALGLWGAQCRYWPVVRPARRGARGVRCLAVCARARGGLLGGGLLFHYPEGAVPRAGCIEACARALGRAEARVSQPPRRPRCPGPKCRPLPRTSAATADGASRDWLL